MTDHCAYKFSVADCDAWFYVDQDDANGAFCPNCGSLLEGYKFETRNIGKRSFRVDWGATYDGHLLITDKAREFLEKYQVKFHLVEANKKPKLYAVFFENVFQFDHKATGTRFLDYCETCGQYESVVGTMPFRFSSPPEFNPMSIYRSDIVFATGREKGPVVVAGCEIKELMSAEFPELDFIEVIVDPEGM